MYSPLYISIFLINLTLWENNNISHWEIYKEIEVYQRYSVQKNVQSNKNFHNKKYTYIIYIPKTGWRQVIFFKWNLSLKKKENAWICI